MTRFFLNIFQTLFQYFQHVEKLVKGLPIIRSIPGFNSLPEGLNTDNLRFYKLCNLVLTLGMFVHFSWIFIFFFTEAYSMAFVNIASVLLYIFCIVINRKGYHLSSSIIMVGEIIVHQIIAVRFFGWDAGFQYYVFAISLFPFLMPQGKWVLKATLLISSLMTFLLLNYFYSDAAPLFLVSPAFLTYFKISNIAFSFIAIKFFS
jgi:hypothetical protein